jgi:hypothetical protein
MALRVRQRINTANKQRVAADLPDGVLRGLRDAWETAAIYGAPKPGGGQPRQFATFADFLRDGNRSKQSCASCLPGAFGLAGGTARPGVPRHGGSSSCWRRRAGSGRMRCASCLLS